MRSNSDIWDPDIEATDIAVAVKNGVVTLTGFVRSYSQKYQAEAERLSHYFRARLPDQFDAVFHFDETRAVEPLERTAKWEAGEVPETFPFGV
jgi:hypothetical protein